MIRRTLLIATLTLTLAAISGCPDANTGSALGGACDGSTGVYLCKTGLVCAHDGTCQDPGSGIYGPTPEGGNCQVTDDCGYGLVCGPEMECIVGGVVFKGGVCSLSEHCQYALVCGAAGKCVSTGQGREGAECLGAQDCYLGLECAGDLTCKDPEDPEATGVSGPGEACQESGDCRYGLLCYLDNTCQAPELWSGRDCSESQALEQDEGESFRIFFEVPRAEPVKEFYRLPFPNDIRLKDGRVDLSGHPVPDTPLAAGVVSAYIEAIQDEMTGFSTQGASFLRFSKALDFSTIALTGDNPNLFLVDIDPSSDGYGQGWPLSMYSTTADGKYICQNWLSLKPTDGYPLRHGTTYAVIVLGGVMSKGGLELRRDKDFEAVIGTEQPGDQELVQAWTAYQPLRDYLTDDTITPVGQIDQVKGASVFSTMDPDRPMAGFRDKIRDCQGDDCSLLPAPAPAGLSLSASESTYHHLSGTIGLPIFQVGQKPYLEEGGQIEFDPTGAPIIQGSEQVAFNLTVPLGTPPVDGWPVVIFAHGTGGSADSMLGNGVAARLAQVEVTLSDASGTARFAVLGIDGVHHGARRQDTDPGPDILYFNFLNPAAAKYNAMQGAAENFQLVRMIEHLQDNPPAVSGLDDQVLLDPDNIFYFGHSQGTLTGPLFLAYSPAVGSAVLSAAGGNLVLSLLTKTEPINIAGATQLVLADGQVNKLHPMLNLMQLYFDPVDTTNYGGDLSYSPRQVGQTNDDPPLPIMAGPKNLFMSFGRDDPFTTEQTMISLARAIGIAQLNDEGSTCNCLDSDCDSVDSEGLHLDVCKISGLPTTESPVRKNVWWNGEQRTGVLKMYLPDGYSGHFALFEHPDGPDDYANFLGSTQVDLEGVPSLLP